ncbi:MAG: ABC transporter permease subunit [Spiroplasma sp.]
MNVDILNVLVSALVLACPLILLSTGGILNTRAGIANFGFDGIMCAGASLYCLIISQLKVSLGNNVIFLAFFLTILLGLVFSLIYSFATITFKANQMLISMVLNFLGYGLAVVLPIAFLGSLNFSLSSIYIKLYPIIVIIMTLILVYLFAVILLLTRFGLYIKSLGENPTVAAFSYIKVTKERYFISFFSSSLACFAGALLVYINPNLFISNNNFVGLGFLVIVLSMMGQSKFVFTAFLCIIVAFLLQLSFSLQAISQIQMVLPGWFLGMIPYLASLLFMMIFRYDTSLPLSWNVPYIKTGQIK